MFEWFLAGAFVLLGAIGLKVLTEIERAIRAIRSDTAIIRMSLDNCGQNLVKVSHLLSNSILERLYAIEHAAGYAERMHKAQAEFDAALAESRARLSKPEQ